MQTKTKERLSRLRAALLAFTTLVAITTLWAVSRFRTAGMQNAMNVSGWLRHQETSVPEGWKRLKVKDKVTLILPQNMKPAELIGDSLRYREAYSNPDIHITITYADLLDPPSEEKLRRLRMYSCDTPTFLLDRPTYHESVIEIDGRKVKLGVARNLSPDSTFASACFPSADDRAFELYVTANCGDDSALETAKQIFTSIRFKDRP